MSDRDGIFAGPDPFFIAQQWLDAASKTEPNDPNAIALSSVDQDGMPNVRMVLLKEIEPDAFVFYTNYDSRKGQEIATSGKVAFVLHWKSLARQIRVRGLASKEDGEIADAYYKSRSLKSRIGAWASQQSQPLTSRATLMADVARVTVQKGVDPERPPFWGGFRIVPLEIEFWADGAFRLHDRFRWSRNEVGQDWEVTRLSP
ncbi:pyridoxamine 5'-phosphate oxidase [Yoonia sp.]|uniref:pyridoxamine 5'-phosphate oxidase n=1 Tax=Yoonia sp. TaxID=2212373 RepID=UPI003974ABEB